MDLNLTDHVVIVTGASKGIGLAITRTVVAASRTATTELTALGPAVRRRGHPCRSSAFWTVRTTGEP